MKKHILLITILFTVISGNIYAQSTYSGNVSVTDESFFRGFTKDSSNYFFGGCNAFPIGTYVDVKLPYADNSVYVKIVSRIPEDGIFILIEKSAGEKLNLEVGDVLPVRIQVKSFTPPPLEDLDSSEELNPEPEIKGLTSKSLAPVEEVVEDIASDEPETAEVLPTTPEVVPAVPVVPVVPIVSEEDAAEEETPEDEIVIEEPIEEVVEEDPKGITEDSETYADDLPEESMFEEVEEDDSEYTEETEEVEETPEKPKVTKTKRIYFLEPASKKPPVGGIPDSELIPVTTVDKSLTLEKGYYLQVGIYKESDNLEIDSEKLKRLNFPYIAVKEESEQRRQRLLVGPVNNDELGVIMLNLKSKGFRDFFRYKKKTK